MSGPTSEVRDLRPAWRWGVWIGALLLVVGILALLLGFGLVGGVLQQVPDGTQVQTPGDLHRLARGGVLMSLQGVLSALIGGGLLTLCLLKLRAQRIRGRNIGSPGAVRARDLRSDWLRRKT